MAKFFVEIETNNAAFANGNFASEITRILYSVADRVNSRAECGRPDLPCGIRDINGNRVGCFGHDA